MSGGGGRRLSWGMVALVGLIGFFYVWTLVSAKRAWRWGEPQQDFYNQLVDGFLDGQLNLKVEVAPELLRVKDPYDPAQRPPGAGLHDATFYQGKYYIYFGVVPAVVLLLPFTVVTGMDLPLPAAVGVFVFVGFLLSVAAWSDVKRRYFPAAGATIRLACGLALGLASLGPVLLRRPTIYEVAIASAYCFAMGALWCAGRALHAARRRAMWVAGASLCLGLAVGSRPSYVLAAPLAMGPLAWWWWRHGRAKQSSDGVRRSGWLMVLAGAGPLALCGLLLGLYNYLRFGSVSEFGVRYILSGVYESRMTHFSTSYLGFNLQNYFLTVPTWSEWFPFIRPRPWPAGPAGIVPGDGYFGVLTTLPLTWFALVAPAALWWRRKNAAEAPLRVWLASVLCVAVGAAMLLMGFYASATRYQVDFVPALILAGCVGLAATDAMLAKCDRRWLRRMGRCGLVGVALYSAFFGLILSVQSNDEFRGRNYAHYRDVARWFNRLPAWIDRVAVGRQRPLDLAVQFSPGAANGETTVFSTGREATLGRVFIRRSGERRMQLGFEQANGAVRLSRWFESAPTQPHRLRIDFDPFYPFPEHPDYPRWASGSAVAPERRLRIEWDGEGMIDDRISSLMTAPDGAAGREQGAPNSGGSGAVASALVTVRKIRTAEMDAELRDRDCVRLRLRLSSLGASGEPPLVRLGSDGGGLALFVKEAGEHAIQLACRSETRLLWESAPIAVDRAVVHEVVFRLRGLGAEQKSSAGEEWRLECGWNGVIVASTRLPEKTGREGFVRVAKKTSVEVARGAAVAGTIYSREQFANGQDPLLASHGPVRLRVEFPLGRAGQREPLIISGATGRGDFLCVEYMGDTQVRFTFESWGGARVQSAPVSIDFRQPHDVRVRFGGLIQGPEAGPLAVAKESRITVELDGNVVWKEPVDFYAAETDEIYFGSNPIGGTACAPRFTGQLLEVERLREPERER